MDIVELGTFEHKGFRSHSVHFEHFLYKADQTKISVRKVPEVRAFNLGKGRMRFLNFFQFRINGELCSMHNGDAVNISPKSLEKTGTSVMFITQLKASQKERLYELNKQFGYRIYPFILPSRQHKKIVDYSDHNYDTETQKSKIAHMSFGTKFRRDREPWINYAKKTSRQILLRQHTPQ